MKTIYIKMIVFFIPLSISGCSMTLSKNHTISTPLNTPFSYPYDRPIASNPCVSGTENYQKCINNTDSNPSITGRY
jgi:hypothetical protein